MNRPLSRCQARSRGSRHVGTASWFFATTVALGCHRAEDASAHVPGPLSSALLAFAAQQGMAPAEVAETWKAIDALAERVRERRPAAGKDVIDRLNEVVFGELGFVREVDKTDAEYLLLPAVVKNRRGGCVGLSALYLALGERLRLPLAGVLVPGHFFVRAGVTTESGTSTAPRVALARRNVELLRAGEAMPDDWYIRKYDPPLVTAPVVSPYMRPLAIEEVIAVHWFNIGNQHRERGDLAGAAAAFGQALAGFPSFAEAAASEGAARHLLGDLGAAARSYDAASRVRRDLPGLAHNLAALDAERAATTSRPTPRSAPAHPEQKSGSTPRRSTP